MPVDLTEVEERFTVIREGEEGHFTSIRQAGDTITIGTATGRGPGETFSDVTEIAERFTSLRESGGFTALRELGDQVAIGVVGGRGPVGATGPAGPPGAIGPIGGIGPKGDAGGTYRHVQGVPSSVWTIAHDLDFYPGGIIVRDSGGEIHDAGRIEYLDTNTIRISFFVAGQLAAFSGEAFIS